MEHSLKRSCLPILVAVAFSICSASAFAQEQNDQENNILVGRISHIEGQLLRYVPDNDDWVLTEKDTPFGEYDNVFSSEDAKVEIIMPNNTLVRIGADTQVQLIELTSEVTEVDVSSGTVRLYNKSSSAQIRATTPFGDVIMPPETVCDIFVHETQAEIVSLKGSVGFIRIGSKTRHDLIAGSSSIIATSEQIIASNHSAPPAWNTWNVDRDVQWTKQMQARGDSEKYLPESLQDHAYDLEENGRWERVYYDGADRYFWRPVYVSAGWTPFSSGRWIAWHGEQTWVPCEPFGYVTHHYGNWVYARNCWYWAPPVSAVMVSTGAPFLSIGMSWYPGRVAWVSSSISIGWFPLAPFEMYYSSRYWGPRCRVRYYNNYYDCRTYRHYKHARYIDHHRYHGSKNYRHAGLRKGQHGEKHRGSALFPEKTKKNNIYKNKNNYASNMPQYRDKIKKIDVRKGKQGRQNVERTVNMNPFKRRLAGDSMNKIRTGKTVVKKTSKQIVRKDITPQKNTSLAKTKQTKRFAKADVQRKKVRFNKAKQSYSKPSKKIAQTRNTFQTSRRDSTGKVVKKVTRFKQSTPKGFVVKNTGFGTRVQSKSSNRAYSAKRSNTAPRVSSAYAGSARRQSSRQNSMGKTQSYASSGRRW